MPGTEEQTTPADFHCLVFYISENGKNLQSENPNLNRTLKSPSPRILTKGNVAEAKAIQSSELATSSLGMSKRSKQF